jgi:hypothetical protein
MNWPYLLRCLLKQPMPRPGGPCLLATVLVLSGCGMAMQNSEEGTETGEKPAKAAPADTLTPRKPADAAAVPALPAPPLADALMVPSPKEVQVIGDTELLVSYFSRLRRLQGADLARELETVRTAWTRNATDYNRVAYAMVLAQPGTGFMDEGRALELLDPLVKRGDDNLRGLAFMLFSFIQEQRRMRGEVGATQQKLDALKSLERNLIERDQNNPGRK